MDTRATYVIPRAFIQTCLVPENTFEDGTPVGDVMRVEKTETSILLKYRKHETRGLKTLTPETLKQVKNTLFQGDLVNCRSLLFDTSMNMINFTPPKSVAVDTLSSPIFEKFVEGTMMSVFYHPTLKTWEMATRSVIGGRNQFFQDTNRNQQTITFRKMFLDAMTDAKLEFEMLPQEYCYTFVVQHPHNRVVVPFNKTALYLVGMYRIHNDDEEAYRIEEVDLMKTKELAFMSRVRYPERYEGTLDEIREKYASATTDYATVGVILRDGVKRAKLRNPVYEQIRRLRGNQPKQQFQYLVLRQEGRISEFLKHYPEMRKSCSIWRNQVHLFTKQLHNYYMNVFVLHKTPIQDIPFEYRPHVITLHEKYIHELKEKNERVTKDVVIKYVNTMPVPRLMFCINSHIRKQHRDFKAKLVENKKNDMPIHPAETVEA